MSTQLTSPPIKARPKGTQEAAEPSVELLQAVNPAKKRLAEVLTAYDKAGLDLAESQAHLSRNEVDQESTLNNLELSDEESANRVAVSQRSIAIYRAQVNSRESAQAKLLKELKPAVNDAHNELSNLCASERARRSVILRGCMIEAGRLIGNFVAELDTLLEYSGLIQEIRRIEISSGSLLFCDSAEQITGIARRILDGYEAIAAKQKEQI